MGYFNPQETVDKIRKETGISNTGIRSGQEKMKPKPKKKTPAEMAAAKKAKERQYFIDRGEGVPPHLK